MQISLIINFAKVFDYNVPGGKQFRVMQIIMGYKHLMDKSEQTPEKMRQVYIISWALELVRKTSAKMTLFRFTHGHENLLILFHSFIFLYRRRQ